MNQPYLNPKSEIPDGPGFFLLGRSGVITDNENSQNSGFSGKLVRPEKGRFQGRRRR
jgi:hypothetical protein